MGEWKSLRESWVVDGESWVVDRESWVDSGTVVFGLGFVVVGDEADASLRS